MTPRRTIPTLLLCVAVLLAAGAAPAATGGPDALDYTWADSDEPGVRPDLPVVTTWTDLRALGFTGDDAVTRIDLPAAVFPGGFPFYGTRYPRLWLSSNGWLSFEDPAGNSHPTPANVPAPPAPRALLAFFWDDWTLEGIQPIAQTGPTSAGDGFAVWLQVYRKGDANAIGRVILVLYQTGAIQIQYSVDAASRRGPASVIGIEEPNGGVGLPYMSDGAARNGANFRNDYAVWFFPRGNLDCSNGVTALGCPTPRTVFDSSVGVNNVSAYHCAGSTWTGFEKVFSLTLTTASNLDIQIGGFGARSMAGFLMRPGCSEFSGCIVGGVASLQPKFLAPGTYYLAVDGATVADNGRFDLTLTCTDAVTDLPCGTLLLTESVTGTGAIAGWSCLGPGSLPGPEKLYQVVLPQAATLTATLSNKTDPSLQVVLADPATFTPSAPSCFAAAPTQIRRYNAGPGPVYVAVDGAVAADYAIQAGCERKLQCPAPASVITLSNPTPITGSTAGKPSLVDAYYCTNSAFGVPPLEATGYTGGEDIYEFDVPVLSTVGFLFSPQNPDMRLLILSDCYEGTCVMEGGCAETLAPGRYRLVVDGVNGASGPYSLSPLVLPLGGYNRWTACNECRDNCTHTPDEIQNQEWHFNSRNFCGTGCDFSLFAVVECGSEFHIPFYDCETGHMQVFDVFKSQYVNLTATNDLPVNTALPAACRYTSTGTQVEWEDSTCSAVPCPPASCGGGRDCRTNNVVMDVSFQGTPNVCGVYRLDFQSWGGWEWYAYANCTADRTPLYPLYRDMCSAISAYRPLPEIGISDVSVTGAACATGAASGTMTIENVGCLPAAGIEIVIEQAPPLPANPQTLAISLDKGATQVVPWSYTTSTTPAQIVFRVDPGTRLLECSENTGGTVSCGFNSTLQRSVPRTICGPPCSTTANAGSPQSVCAGSGATLDGGGSVLSCPAGTPQYRWDDAAGNPICDWNAAADCALSSALLPPGVHDFTLRTRCVNDTPPCETSSTTSITVTAGAAPPTLGNTLLGAKRMPDTYWQWTPLATAGITAYRIYKDPARDVPLATRTRIADVGPAVSSATEASAVTGPPAMAYHQLVAVACDGVTESPY